MVILHAAPQRKSRHDLCVTANLQILINHRLRSPAWARWFVTSLFSTSVNICADMMGQTQLHVFVIFRLDMLPIGTAVSNSIFHHCLCHPLNSVPPGQHTFVNTSVFLSSRTRGWGRERMEKKREGEREILYLLHLNCFVLSVIEIMISHSFKPENAASGCC